MIIIIHPEWRDRDGREQPEDPFYREFQAFNSDREHIWFCGEYERGEICKLFNEDDLWPLFCCYSNTLMRNPYSL